MKYHVTVTKISYGGVDVEAATEKEAREKALQDYDKDNVSWKDSEISDLNAEPASPLIIKPHILRGRDDSR